ncbi:hypothetical protein [Streptomyces brasiliscabiei]|uniref:hypothetical protein n=1 Tax=Streptomyces brasiliscabiei TaxID=2736302 RepID=UPI001C10686D|nr:hypothetical protein [Streptomyces brasiliscabiei]
MGLDEEIEKVRAEWDAQDAGRREKREQQERITERLLELAADAVQRLTPYARRETAQFLHVVQPSPVGTVTGQGGRMYRQVDGQWCWLLREVTRREADGVGPVRTVILLLQDGRFARVRLDWLQQEAGVFVTSVDVHEPVAADFVAARFANARLNDKWIGELEKDVARVLVDCERGPAPE